MVKAHLKVGTHPQNIMLVSKLPKVGDTVKIRPTGHPRAMPSQRVTCDEIRDLNGCLVYFVSLR